MNTEKCKKNINIVFSSDNNYAQFLGVALCSIFENKNGDYNIDVYVLDGGISENNKNKLKILEEKYGFKINYITINKEFFKNFYISHHITQAAYYRILIPDLIPANIKKILYLDCDIIVINDIKKIHETNIENYIIGAIEENVTDRQEELGMPLNAKYFNSGVLLINIEKWKKEEITNKLINFIKNNQQKIINWDQDALNAILWGKWLKLPKEYNYMTSIFEKIENSKTINPNTIIIHYSSPIKPWNYSYENRLKEKYFYYVKKTPWENKKITDINIKNIVMSVFHKLLGKKITKKIINYLIKKIK